MDYSSDEFGDAESLRAAVAELAAVEAGIANAASDSGSESEAAGPGVANAALATAAPAFDNDDDMTDVDRGDGMNVLSQVLSQMGVDDDAAAVAAAGCGGGAAAVAAAGCGNDDVDMAS